jgi:hypothetical protein
MLNANIDREAPEQLIQALEATYARGVAAADPTHGWNQPARYIDPHGGLSNADDGYACGNFALMGGVDRAWGGGWAHFMRHTPGMIFGDAINYVCNPFTNRVGNGEPSNRAHGDPAAPAVDAMISRAQLERLRELEGASRAEVGPNWADIPVAPARDATVVMRNRGPNHATARCRFWHKLMKRISEMYGWEIRDYDWDPGGLLSPAKSVGIACTSDSWTGATHFGLVLRGGAPAGGNVPAYSVFQTTPDRRKRVWGWCEKLWDTAAYPMTVLWVKQVPTYARERIQTQYA